MIYNDKVKGFWQFVMIPFYFGISRKKELNFGVAHAGPVFALGSWAIFKREF